MQRSLRRTIGGLCAVGLLLASIGTAGADSASGDIAGAPTTSINVTAGQPFNFTTYLFLTRQGQAAPSVSWSGPVQHAGTCGDITGSAASPSTLTMPTGWSGTSNGTRSIDRKPDGTLATTESEGVASSTTVSGTAGAAGQSCKLRWTASGDNIPSSLVDIVVSFVSAPSGPTNQAPVVTANPASGVEGSVITLSGSFTDTDGPASPPPSAKWTIVSQTGVSPGSCTLANDTSLNAAELTCTDNGSAQVKLTVTDAAPAPAAGSATATVTVSNAAPVVAAVVPSNVTACSVDVSASFTDAGSADTHTAVIDWGDATTDDPAALATATKTVSGSHTYTSNGSYTIEVAVTDDDGGVGSNSTTFGTRNTASAILDPVKPNGGSTFKIGSSIPLKITVTGCGGGAVTTLAPTVDLVKIDSVVEGVEQQSPTSEQPTNGKQMAWNGEHYHYVLSTKHSQFDNGSALSSGTYRVTITDPSFFSNPTEKFDLKR